jgi:uncharacterized membrane protein YhaH (DUF805 family)
VAISPAAWHDDAMSVSPSSRSLLPPVNARLASGPFVLAAIALYLVSFASQMLLSAPVTARVSVVPFVLVQIVLIWLWIVVHMRRLHDAGRPTGIVIGIALVYALEVVLLTLLIWILAAGGAGGASTDAGIFHLFVILYLLGVMAGDPSLAGLQVWLIGFAVVMLLPVLIAIGFSLWTATRPSASSSP